MVIDQRWLEACGVAPQEYPVARSQTQLEVNMPIYIFEHIKPNPDCPDPVELILGIGEEAETCPGCGAARRPTTAITEIVKDFRLVRSMIHS